MDKSAKDQLHRNTQLADACHNSKSQPIIVEDVNGEVRIHLEGSHTTTSETESYNANAESSAHLTAGIENAGCNTSPQPSTFDDKPIIDNLIKQQIGHEDVIQIPPKAFDGTSVHCRNIDLDHVQIEKENDAIGQRFKQIMDMFNTFTNSLEILEQQTSSLALTSSESAHNKLSQLRYDTATNSNSINGLYDETALDQHSVCTTTSGLEVKYQDVPCQTSMHEDFSIGQTSIVRSVSGTSVSELQHSLNNYARSDNALKISTNVDGHPLKIAPPVESRAAVVVAEPCSQPFNTIHIETMSTTSLSALHRPPLCQRLWDVITDFCAAICLCLQVNRDCILCLGFFAAFVVSASFLTAFFYRTLSMSPPLWQTPPHRYLQGGTGTLGGFNPRG